MPLLVIRKAERVDVPVLAQIAYDAWATGILPLLKERPGMRATEERRLNHVVNETLDRIIVAEMNGIPVGWCSRARGRAYVPYLFVIPQMQSQGIGSALLGRIETMLELGGAKRVHLETPADNVRAVRFYERQGYRILAMRPDGRHAHDPFLSVHLEKRLNPFVGEIEDEE